MKRTTKKPAAKPEKSEPAEKESKGQKILYPVSSTERARLTHEEIMRQKHTF